MSPFLYSTFGHQTVTTTAQGTQLPLINNNLFSKTQNLLKQGIWLYFFLLIFEGALRKWFLPGLATPLLIIRDPLAICMILISWRNGLLPFNLFMAGMSLVGIIGTFTATLLGHGSLPVALFGARILLIHFPIMFVIGHVFDRSDVIKLGKAVLWIAIPMTILIALQFYSPQSAWVNRGVGGDIEGAGFSGALGFYRPPGTFSFTNGTTLFYSLLTCYVLFFWLSSQYVSRLLLFGATVALLAAIPFSISRALLFQVILSVLFTILAISRQPRYLGRMFITIVIGIGAMVILSQTNILQTPIEAFTERFENASVSEGGLEGTLIDRFLGGLVGALTKASEQPFFGYGLGMGTNVGSMLLTGDRQFLIAEEEWGRLVGELGPLLGLTVIFLRTIFVIKITLLSYKKLILGEMMPWLLLSFGFLTVLQAQWAQPTALGFSTLIGGLILASFRVSVYQSLSFDK